MSELRFETKTETETVVKLEGKIIGKIIEVPVFDGRIGYQYLPTGNKKFKGDIFAKLSECKRSLSD